MKTTNNLRNLFRVLMITGVLAILNIGFAQPYFASTSITNGVIAEVDKGNDMGKSNVKTISIQEKSVLEEMDETPDYWVEFLKDQVSKEVNESPMFGNEVSPLFDQMESDSFYWMNYLKNRIENESNTNVLNAMESDPLYWKHYLDSSVDTETL